MLAGPLPHDQERVDEVIQLLRNGGWVDRALAEAAARIETAEAALDAIPDMPAKPVLHRLGQFLLDQVVAARA